MDRRKREKITGGTWLAPLAVAGGSGAASLFPALSSVLIYDREAILRGELWRIYTGHLVHFSPSHLLYDLFGVLLLVWVAKRRNYRGTGWLCLWSATSVSCANLLLEPEMLFYGGLSGIAHALIFFAALRAVTEKDRWRLLFIIVLLVSIGNLVVETASGHPSLVSPGEARFVPAVLAHATGALTGAVMAWRQGRAITADIPTSPGTS